MTAETAKVATWRAIPRGVWALGFVSMFMDISSEMIHALLPIYLVTVLGTSTLTVGIIEGLAEATAMIIKVFSGALSDWLGRRKLLVVVGYGLAAFTKPAFPLARLSAGWLPHASSIVSARGSAVHHAMLFSPICHPRVCGARVLDCVSHSTLSVRSSVR
jgi:MFS family permease